MTTINLMTLLPLLFYQTISKHMFLIAFCFQRCFFLSFGQQIFDLMRKERIFKPFHCLKQTLIHICSLISKYYHLEIVTRLHLASFIIICIIRGQIQSFETFSNIICKKCYQFMCSRKIFQVRVIFNDYLRQLSEMHFQG